MMIIAGWAVRFCEQARQQTAVAPSRMRASETPDESVCRVGLRQETLHHLPTVIVRPPSQNVYRDNKISDQNTTHPCAYDGTMLRNGPGPKRSDSCAIAIENPAEASSAA